jgi:hypothetical protein
MRYVDNQRNLMTNEINKLITIKYLQQINLKSADAIIEDNANNLVVSLTSFGRRINEVYLAIESIGLQTVRPNNVILWLSEDNFNDSNLPMSLKNLQKRGLSIKYCQDIKSYKKLIPTLKIFNDSLIITIDDDCMYQNDLVEKLLYNYSMNPGIIYCGSAKVMQISKNKIMPYSKWSKNDARAYLADKKNFAVGFSGVLYFPNCFHDDVINDEKFMKLCPHADDIWFKAMSLLKGIKVKSIGNQLSSANSLVPVEVTQSDSLSVLNIIQGHNDLQLKKVFSAYDIYDKFM